MSKIGKNLQKILMTEKLKINMKITTGKAELTFKTKNEFKHVANTLHGMCYFKLLDNGRFFAVDYLIEDVFVLTSQFNIYFTKPVFEGKLKVTGKVRHNSKKTISFRLYFN